MLETDASGSGLGAVLAQRQDDGSVRPLAMQVEVYNNTRKTMVLLSWRDWLSCGLPSTSDTTCMVTGVKFTLTMRP